MAALGRDPSFQRIPQRGFRCLRWYSGELTVAWSGNATNTADLTWRGNDGEVRVTPYDIEDNKQRAGTLAVSIEQTADEQDVFRSVDAAVVGREREVPA